MTGATVNRVMTGHCEPPTWYRQSPVVAARTSRSSMENNKKTSFRKLPEDLAEANDREELSLTVCLKFLVTTKVFLIKQLLSRRMS